MNTLHPFRFGVTLFRAASRQEWVEKCHQIEDLGYSVLQVPDHLGNQFSPILALMAAAEASRALRLVTLVLDINYRHLALLAKEVATLDLLSEGRFELGLGAGWIERRVADGRHSFRSRRSAGGQAGGSGATAQRSLLRWADDLCWSLLAEWL